MAPVATPNGGIFFEPLVLSDNFGHILLEGAAPTPFGATTVGQGHTTGPLNGEGRKNMLTKAALLTIFLIAASSSSAAAKTTEEIIADLGICYNRCSVTSQTCTTGCCGLLFCRKSCVLSCDSALTSCKKECESDIVGNELSSAFFDDATVSRNGRIVRVGGPLDCVDGAVAEIAVTLTQHDTGAIATGQVHEACTEDTDSFRLHANATGSAAFEAPGAVEACGSARIRSGATSIDAFQWCRTLTLVPKGVELEE